MIPEDRLEHILALLSERGTVSVSELCSRLYVSPATVRRDLSELSRRGMIVRSFGGAVSTSHMVAHPQSAAGKPQAENPIGLRAAQLVREHETIFLGSGSLVLSMAPFLQGLQSLTVVTNSAKIASALANSVSGLYCTGGRYDLDRELFYGTQAAAVAARFRYDRFFCSFDALSADGSLLSRSLEEMSVLQSAAVCARTRVLLCGEAQFDGAGTRSFFSLRQMDVVVTDAPNRFSSGYTGSVEAVQKPGNP